MHHKRKSELIRNYLWCCVICNSSSYPILAMIRHSAFKTQREQTITKIYLNLASCRWRVLSPEVAQDISGACPSPFPAQLLSFFLWVCCSHQRGLCFSIFNSAHIGEARMCCMGTERRARAGAQRCYRRCQGRSHFPSRTGYDLEIREPHQWLGTQSWLLATLLARPGSASKRIPGEILSKPPPVPSRRLSPSRLECWRRGRGENWLRESWCIIEGFT